MFKKDLIEKEIQKLAQVLAKIIGLKNEGNVDEATDLSFQTKQVDFGLSKDYLEKNSIEEFEDWLNRQELSVEKLNLLGSIMFESVYPFLETEETMQVLHKTALVLNRLETEYHQQSFENLHRREQIDKFLSNLQYE
jgi:hypothetical protein